MPILGIPVPGDSSSPPAGTPTDPPPPPPPGPSSTRPPNTPTNTPPANTPTPPSSTRTPPVTPTISNPLNTASNVAGSQNTPSLPINPGAGQSNLPLGNGITPPAGASPSSTSTDLPSKDSHGTIKIVGYAAGGLLAFAVLVALIMFIMRRLNKRREDQALGDVFDRNSFVRDSVVLPSHTNAAMYGHGEDNDSSERGRPRPPTMIDRHLRAANNGYPDYSGFSAPSHDNHGYNGYNNNGGGGYGNNPGYDQYGNLGYDNYGVQQHNGYDQYAAPPQPGYYQDSPMHSPMNDQFDHIGTGAQYLNHQVGAGAGVAAAGEAGRSLTRQPSGKGVEYPNVGELGRGTSVTPFQAAQYAEIGRKLDSASSHGHGSQDAYAKLDRQQPNGQKRPASAYDADDAYGGI